MPHDFETLAEIQQRIDRLLIADALPDGDQPVAVAGEIPFYYGGKTAHEVAGLWLRMAERNPDNRAFYLAGAIGWASR